MNNFTVELQEPFSYLIVWIILAAVFLAGAIILGLIILRKSKFTHKKRAPKIKPVPPPTLEMIKNKYRDLLWELRQQAESGQISMKKSYQKLSRYIRSFVFESTGLRVQFFTLEEIRSLGIHSLTQLITECYEPEFAESSTRNTCMSIDTAANIINNWYI